jgi:hypothetical protein
MIMRWLLWLLPLLTVSTSLAGDPPTEPRLVARPDAFKTLVNPMCSHCWDEAKRRGDELRDHDRVLCWLRGYSDGGAIPMRFFLHEHRVISDTYGVFVYDPDAGFARGFAPSLDFTFHGWRNGVMVMRHKDGTLYSCLSGVGFEGPNKGKRLEPVPTLVSDWGYWLREYPGAVAYHMFDKYQPVDLPAQQNGDARKTWPDKHDGRLPADTFVHGVVHGQLARAFPVDRLEKTGILHDTIARDECVVLWHAPTRTSAAYLPIASPPKKEGGTPRKVTLKLDRPNADAPLTDVETGSRWDVAGRAAAGPLKGWTLTWLDGTSVRWRAWAAEYPETTVYGDNNKGNAASGGGKGNAASGGGKGNAASGKDAAKEIAGTAEFLRSLPKMYGTVREVDPARHRVMLLADGEKTPKVWPLTPDAEVKVAGWWGRLEQFKPGDRVWAWLRTDRNQRPVAVCMLADELSEKDMHERLPKQSDFEAKQSAQKALLRKRWIDEGLPGTITFLHTFNGEMELMLDHEAMRWGRSLKNGDKVRLDAFPPINAAVKQVTPWGERTRLRLVVRGPDQADLAIGGRLRLHMTPPPADVADAVEPPDLDRPRATKTERIEWFLASIYCTCKVGGDGCTGHFYTLANCNPNACGMPNIMRKVIADKIDQSLTDRQIFEQLLKDKGPTLIRPHLMP